MDAGKDIYIVSVPLAAGVLVAAVLFSKMGNDLGWRYFVAGTIPLLLAPLLAGVHFRRRLGYRTLLPFILMFFVLGLFCYSNSLIFKPSRDIRVPSSGISHRLGTVRTAFSDIIDAIPFEESEDNALAKAVTSGDRKALSRETIMNFRQAGAAHLLALSGMHLGIIYIILQRFLLFIGNSILSRKIRSIALVAVTGIYTLICGAGPSLVRAWLFILFAEIGRLTERPQSLKHIFCLALTIHLIVNPEDIIGIGFQLSYLAMVGIVFLWPAVKEWYPAESPGKKIWDSCSLCICCQLFTAPLTLIYFGTFPKHFLITNLIAAPLMSVVMFCCIASAAVCAVLGSSADVSIFACHIMEMPLRGLRWLLEGISAMS